MTEYYLLSSLDHWDKTAPVAKFKLSALILSGIEVSEDARTRVLVMTIFSTAKIYYWSGLQT